MHYEKHCTNSGPKEHEPNGVPSLLAGVVHAVKTQQPALILEHQRRNLE